MAHLMQFFSWVLAAHRPGWAFKVGPFMMSKMWCRNRREREVKWATCWGKRQNWKNGRQRGEADARGLLTSWGYGDAMAQAAPRAMSRLVIPTSARICMSIRGPCCHQRMPSVWAAIYGHIGIQELFHYQSHADLGILCCHQGPWCHPGSGCCWWPCLGS